MQGTGKTYEHSGNTTEWDDILIKKGIRTREEILMEKGLNPADFIKKSAAPEEVAQKSVAEELNELNVDELDELEDDEEFSDSRILNSYRQIRLNEMKEAAFRNRFGDVREISKADWVREVTESSNNCSVVVHLYEDSVTDCLIMDEALQQLAPRFKYVKFLRIKSTHAIENWPERNLPTLFIYEEGALKTQAVTLQQLNGRSTRAEDVEWFLVGKGVISDSELEEDPKLSNLRSDGIHKISPSRQGQTTVFRSGAVGTTSGLDSDDDDLFE